MGDVITRGFKSVIARKNAGGAATTWNSTTVLANQAAGTRASFAYTPTATYASGDRLVLHIWWDNTGQALTTITDNNSNTWTIDIEEPGNTTLRSSALISTVLNAELNTGDTVTINWGASSYQRLTISETSLSDAGTVDAAVSSGVGAYAGSVSATTTTSNDGFAAVLITSNTNITLTPSGFTESDTIALASNYRYQAVGYGATTAGSTAISATYTPAGNSRIIWVNYSP
tara:strand:+ start:96 stop:785 length:690 start_codon:yes stop_codon:yes gene_type:complete